MAHRSAAQDSLSVVRRSKRSMFRIRLAPWLACVAAASAQPAATEDPFGHAIRPVLMANCGGCHNPNNPRNHINFLKATTAADVEKSRGLWRNVAIQLRNRTMPPGDSKLSEDDRLHVSTWIDERLRMSACNAGDFAGAGVLRRLNRREYRNTVRDLLGVEFNATEMFPADGSGGAGFDTNGETLYIPPLMLERYMEAAQQIADQVIVTPKILKTYSAADLRSENQESSITIPIYVEGQYDVQVIAEKREGMGSLELKVDGSTGVPLQPQPPRRNTPPDVALSHLQVKLTRGLRMLSFAVKGQPVAIRSVIVEQKGDAPSPERLAVHQRFLGTEPGEEPLFARKAARQILRGFLRKAYRRPVQPGDIDLLMKLYDRSEQRGDPFEERMKLMLKAVLAGPQFLFKVEQRSEKPGIYALTPHELAVRLSYFLWSTMPDEELSAAADHGTLSDPKVLTAQTERMLDDPRARSFTASFIGQWLGTQELGGRVFPMLTELQAFYNPPVAADLRAEPVLLFENILSENRTLMELLTANYTFLTARLARFYQVEGQFPDLKEDGFQKVTWADRRRGGITTMASVMAATSHYRQTSPVLRGAWVLETILGTPVPPPPPNVPQLEPVRCTENCAEKAKTASGMRERILAHRENPTCSACHNLMDPIGFALENFDWTGRWREKEFNGADIDASGTLPSGEQFKGPDELRKVLTARREEFLRHFTAKILGYALGRTLQDGDSCTVQRITSALDKDEARARTLIREVVLSTPFRNAQGGAVTIEAPAVQRKSNRPMVVK